MAVCDICGIPRDASYFDESKIVLLKNPDGTIAQPFDLGQELVLASYQLHRNYCGILMSFAQFTDRSVGNNPDFMTSGYQWQIRCNGQPRDPYLTFSHIINPWGYGGFPVQLRLEEGCLVELAIRNTGGTSLIQVGGRISGCYFYNRDKYGGAPNRL